jgi:hypothetical protein
LAKKAFHQVGTRNGSIDVRVSYQIVQLLSEGLYSSPNKAIEELVSNSWDAGAPHTHVILPSDRDDSDAAIVVIDDGIGMDVRALKQHWLLGQSNKRASGTSNPKRRRPIGKFGIGKLATYVLARRVNELFSARVKVRGDESRFGHRVDELSGKLKRSEEEIRATIVGLEAWAHGAQLILVSDDAIEAVG